MVMFLAHMGIVLYCLIVLKTGEWKIIRPIKGAPAKWLAFLSLIIFSLGYLINIFFGLIGKQIITVEVLTVFSFIEVFWCVLLVILVYIVSSNQKLDMQGDDAIKKL